VERLVDWGGGSLTPPLETLVRCCRARLANLKVTSPPPTIGGRSLQGKHRLAGLFCAICGRRRKGTPAPVGKSRGSLWLGVLGLSRFCGGELARSEYCLRLKLCFITVVRSVFRVYVPLFSPRAPGWRDQNENRLFRYQNENRLFKGKTFGEVPAGLPWRTACSLLLWPVK